jgi:hypothetical protein
MSAFCLFGAAYYAQTRWAFALPIAVWFAGDLGIWALTGRLEWAFYNNMITVYLGILIIIGLGLWLRGRILRCLAACNGFFLRMNTRDQRIHVLLPSLRQFACHPPAELGRLSRVFRSVLRKLVIPAVFQSLPFCARIPGLVDILGDFEWQVIPADVRTLTVLCSVRAVFAAEPT